MNEQMIKAIATLRTIADESCDKDRKDIEFALIQLAYREDRRVEYGREHIEEGWYQDYANCPSCGDELDMDKECAYCPMCGQALIWRYDDDE